MNQKSQQNILPLLLAMAGIGMALPSCSANSQTLSFALPQYEIQSGDYVKVKEKYLNVAYRFIGTIPEGVSLDGRSGKIEFADSIPNYTQVLLVASWKTLVSEPVVCTLIYEFSTPTISFSNHEGCDYIADGDIVNATASPVYAITYSLENRVPGISIDSSSGKVAFGDSVANDTEFTVIASSRNNARATRVFHTITEGFVTALNTAQMAEVGQSTAMGFRLDFGDDNVAAEKGALALANLDNSELPSSVYSYDTAAKQLTLKPEFVSTLSVGSHYFKILTSKNAVNITAKIATSFITSAEELAAINASPESLGGYYILKNDIDLTMFLGFGGLGYNDGKGWIPLGTYHDVLDETAALADAFKGTFDGNGHTISGFFINNNRDAYGYNAGFFGYVTRSASISNVGLVGDQNKMTVTASFSGGLAGVNLGSIKNCYADVDMLAYEGDGTTYRYVGGFAGCNYGTISDCYSIGTVRSDRLYGAFVGRNSGILTNCFALASPNATVFSGDGDIDSGNCQLFADIGSMKAFDFSTVFDSRIWAFANDGLPVLTVQIP